ncbi:MAG: thiopurine S-methyltransferase [Gammaproteobacteria bacterium]
MQPDFWITRWQRGETGFHLPDVNPWLRAQLNALQLTAGSHVFVPLCGKSHDLRFLADQGARVTGIELSPLAVEAFFAEQDLEPARTSLHGMTLYTAGGIRLFCGDFFQLTREMLGTVDAVFDRASLVAMPPETRPAYAAHLAGLLPPGARTLLVAFDYPQHEMPGPPFSVPQSEIRSLFGSCFDIAPLGRTDILDAEPRFRARGLTRLTETCWIMLRR